MLIVCQNCGTSYQIDPGTLGPGGRSVRCARCQHVWFTPNTAALAAIGKTHREEVAAFAAKTSVGDATALPDALPAQGPDPFPDATPEEVTFGEAAPMADEPMAEPALDGTPSQALYDLEGDHLPPQSAESFAVVDAPPLAPPAPPVAEDIETVAVRRARRAAKRRRRRWPVPALSTAILALIALDMGLIAWRAEVVRWFPQTASLYAALRLPVNLRGLVFAKVTSETESHEGVQVLVIEGTIASAAGRVVEVPRLRFAVRNASGHEIYTWTALPGKSVLAPGETLTFRSRLASPPRETHDVVVRFFNRRDILASIQ
jgi:predicted Zn finger-like uncharacterized protein